MKMRGQESKILQEEKLSRRISITRQDSISTLEKQRYGKNTVIRKTPNWEFYI